MARGIIYEDVTDTQGNALAGILVTVYETGTLNLATLYDAVTGGNLVNNPLTTDSQGVVQAYTETGEYDLSVAAPTGTFVKPSVTVLDSDDVQAAQDSANAAAASEAAAANSANAAAASEAEAGRLQPYDNIADLKAATGYSVGDYSSFYRNDVLTQVQAEADTGQADEYGLIQGQGVVWKVLAGENGYNVKSFGAVGDGVADDTAPSQAGINVAAINKQTCLFPAAEYLITDTLSIPEGGQLQGETKYQYPNGFNIPPKATTIKFAPTSAKDLFVFDGTTHAGFRFHNSISGFYLEGNSVDATGNSVTAIPIDSVIYARFDNIGMSGFRTGILCNDTINCRFENIYANGFIQALSYTGLATTDVWEQCSFWGSPTGVLMSDTCIGIRFNNILLEQLDNYGFDISATTGNVVVTNAYAEDVPFTNANADNSVFRVGAFGTSAKSTIQLTVNDSNLRGANAATQGSAFWVEDTDGVVVNNTFVRKFVNAFETTNATRDKSVVLSNVTTAACTNIITDKAKIQGNYLNVELAAANLSHEAEYATIRAGSFKPATGQNTSSVSSANTAYTFGDTFFYPSNDNASVLGLGSNRWSVVYAGTGTINTSDARTKDFMEAAEAEKAAAIEIKNNLRKFKFKDAVATKGDSARIHFGASAQQLRDIMESHGLDAADYGFFCFDEWEEEGEHKELYGVRYDELLAFILMAI